MLDLHGLVEAYHSSISWLEDRPAGFTVVCISALLVTALCANWIVRRILLRGIERLVVNSAAGAVADRLPMRVIARLSNIIPALILSYGFSIIPGMPATASTVISNVSHAAIAVIIAVSLSGVLDAVNEVYKRRDSSRLRPIKGYVQVAKIVIFLVTAVLCIGLLVDRSPLILLSGLGAMAAVLMLIFQDTILSFVASVQISSGDIIRLGDWIEMPQLHANGEVIDIALHTVKVQNWDKTISNIPTKKFISDSFINWRGMQDSGGRRIKRCIYLDQQSVGFLSDEEKAKLNRFTLLQEYLRNKDDEIKVWNGRLAAQGEDEVNSRRLTNLGTFRAYTQRYLREHMRIHQGMTLLVRQLEPTPQGLPVEVYCFTDTVAWVDYEGIQSDIFEHLISILPEFGLRLYQQPSGFDMTAGLQRGSLHSF